MPTPNMSMLRIAYRNPSSISVQGERPPIDVSTYNGFTRIQAASIRNKLLSNSSMNRRSESTTSSGCYVTLPCEGSYPNCDLDLNQPDGCVYYCSRCPS